MLKIRKKTWFRTIPLLLMVLALPLLFSCDAGDDGGAPTGPDSNYDPIFPEGSLLALSLNPSSVSVST